MGNNMEIKLLEFMIDCKAPRELADFYVALLGWKIAFEHEQYVLIYPDDKEKGTYPGISFQRNLDFVPPVWPEEPGAQQAMAHLDFAVENLEEAVKHAISCGATQAEKQYSDEWRVMFDPVGHPFCLCLDT